MSGNDKLVAVRTCFSKPEADVVRSLLEAYGIPVYVRGGDMPGVGGISEVGSGLCIMVPANAEKDARAVIEASQRSGDEGGADPS